MHRTKLLVMYRVLIGVVGVLGFMLALPSRYYAHETGVADPKLLEVSFP